jgi:hypothetical protein
MPSLTSTASLSLRWSWNDSTDLSEVTNVGNVRDVVTISDSAICNVAWSDARTIQAGTVDALDLSSLAYDVFGLAGTFSFDRIHKIYIANAVTQQTLTAGGVTSAEIRVGVPDNLTVGHYAASVWQGSHIYLYSEQGWVPADLLRIANVSSVAVPVHIILLGQGEVASA